MIEKGFMVKIVSYAGDMDDYNTCVITGLSAADAQWLDDLYDAFYAISKHERRDYQGSEYLVGFSKAVDQTIAKAGFIYSRAGTWQDRADCKEDFDSSLAYELFGAGCEYTGRIRTPYKLEIYNIPCDLHDYAGRFARD